MTKPYLLEFEIPDLPKTYNQMGRSHWTVKAKEAKKWIKIVQVMSLGKAPKEPLTKARLTLTRISASCPDSDGLVSSFKHVIDGLTEAGVIENDKFENVGMPTYLWVKGKRGEGMIKVKVESI